VLRTLHALGLDSTDPVRVGPASASPQPFLGLLNDYGSPWAIEERTPA
jgi:hypothetical protein